VNRLRSRSGLSGPRRAIAGSFVWTARSSSTNGQYPSDVIALMVLWPTNSVCEIWLRWAEELRRSRKGKVGRSWVYGDGKYLYRAIDRDGALVDVMLSEHRNLAAAKGFFRSAKAVTGVIPDRVTTDPAARPRRLSPGDPDGARQPRVASDKQLPQQPPRAGSPRHPRPMSTHARLQERHISQALLPKPRRASKLSPLSFLNASTHTRFHATVSPHALNSHRARRLGSGLNERRNPNSG
jgi:hypothetical protein